MFIDVRYLVVNSSWRPSLAFLFTIIDLRGFVCNDLLLDCFVCLCVWALV